MNARNLAMCFAPSLFDAGAVWKRKSLRRRARCGGNGAHDGVLSTKDLDQHRAEHECLTAMILNAKDLFTVRARLQRDLHQQGHIHGMFLRRA